MSSPYIVPGEELLDRHVASSPAPAAQPSRDEHDPQDDSLRPVKLKVLYTFDDQNKTNCLARWPRVLRVRTARLDETTEIGVVELKTCIQAIVAASPEIVARLGQDYTVYAYDYSEYETPLVGQGMLSWVLASTSSTPDAPAHRSRTIVTGRVCRNLLGGLFAESGGSTAETLEVKLRLVPVPTSLQSEYVQSMKQYRDLSRAIPADFDPQAWSDFVRANPGILSAVPGSRSQSPAISAAGFEGAAGKQPAAGFEHAQRLLLGGGTSQHQGPTARLNSVMSLQPDLLAHSPVGEDFERAMSPTPSMQSVATQMEPTHPSQLQAPQPPFQRSVSSLSGRVSQSSMSRRPSTPALADSGYLSNDERQEQEEPPKKRARVVRAEIPGKAALSSMKAESLRVAASSAASIRVFQPAANRPQGNEGRSLEEPPRAPTPIPQGSRHRQPLSRGNSQLGRSGLAQESSFSSEADYGPRPKSATEVSELLESTATSPEIFRAALVSDASSPAAEPGSSPPIIRALSTVPSSPVLPTLQPSYDSGFASEPLDDLFFDPNEPVKAQDPEPLKSPPKKAKGFGMDNVNHYQPKNVNTSATPASQKAPEPQDNTAEHREVSHSNACRAIGLLKRSQTWGGGERPPVKRARSAKASTPRPSQAFSTDPASQPTTLPVTDGPSPLPEQSSVASETALPESTAPAQAKRRTNKNLWDKERRKAAMQKKLEESVASGCVPQFCVHCGAIETPTWRKAFSKVFSGDGKDVVFSTAEGGIIAMEILEKDKGDNAKLLKLYKKTLLKTDEGWTDILLCNPCGLWLVSRNTIRPENLWGKPAARKKDDKPPRDRKRSKQKKPDPGNNHSDTIEPKNEDTNPASDSPSGQEENTGSTAGQTETKELDTRPTEDDSKTLDTTEKAKSVEPKDLPPKDKEKPPQAFSPAAVAALQRAIDASPSRAFLGSRKSPIDIDGNSPEPARRTLFPSPKSGGPLGVNAPTKGDRGISKKGKDSAKEKDVLSSGGSVANRGTGQRARASSCGEERPSVDREAAELEKRLAAEEENSRQEDKENLPPCPDPPMNDSFDELFSDLPAPVSRTPPVTPSKSRGGAILKSPSSVSDLFKTPVSASKHPPGFTPRRHSINTGDFFSSAAKAFLHHQTLVEGSPPAMALIVGTPTRSPSNKGGASALATPGSAINMGLGLGMGMTPFTRHMTQLLSTDGIDSPGRFLSDMLLPDLDESAGAGDNTIGPGALGSSPNRLLLRPSGQGNAMSAAFDFSDLNASSDPIVPSSPPAWFKVYDENECDGGGGGNVRPGELTETGQTEWMELGILSSPLKGIDSEERSPDRRVASGADEPILETDANLNSGTGVRPPDSQQSVQVVAAN